MKLQKKTIMLLSLILGVVLLASTAFADSMTKTGYEELKDTIKFTAASIGNGVDSGTVNMSYILKDNDTVLATKTDINKMDVKNNISETKGSLVIDGVTVQNNFSYSDKEGNISYDQYSDTYYVNKYINKDPAMSYNGGNVFTNPFTNQSAMDVEKIFDAAIGNLKNYVFVTVNDDKSKVFTGSLSDAQIPALVNAVVSFASKQMFSTNDAQMNGYATKEAYANSSPISSDPKQVRDITQPNLPKITGDVFVKNVNGKVTVSADGLISSVYFYGVLSGKDAQGKLHDLSVEALVKLENINSTVITKPDLTGKKVIESTDMNVMPETLSSKFEGTYKVDIIIDKSQQLVKIGEKTLVIESIKDGKITGKYFETYKAGYESYITDTSEFSFESPVTDPYNVQLKFTDKAGNIQTGSMNFDQMTYRISFWLDSVNNSKFTDNNFARVFAD
jgi:hypothetical protein